MRASGPLRAVSNQDVDSHLSGVIGRLAAGLPRPEMAAAAWRGIGDKSDILEPAYSLIPEVHSTEEWANRESRPCREAMIQACQNVHTILTRNPTNGI